MESPAKDPPAPPSPAYLGLIAHASFAAGHEEMEKAYSENFSLADCFPRLYEDTIAATVSQFLFQLLELTAEPCTNTQVVTKAIAMDGLRRIEWNNLKGSRPADMEEALHQLECFKPSLGGHTLEEAAFYSLYHRLHFYVAAKQLQNSVGRAIIDKNAQGYKDGLTNLEQLKSRLTKRTSNSKASTPTLTHSQNEAYTLKSLNEIIALANGQSIDKNLWKKALAKLERTFYVAAFEESAQRVIRAAYAREAMNTPEGKAASIRGFASLDDNNFGPGEGTRGCPPVFCPATESNTPESGGTSISGSSTFFDSLQASDSEFTLGSGANKKRRIARRSTWTDDQTTTIKKYVDQQVEYWRVNGTPENKQNFQWTKLKKACPDVFIGREANNIKDKARNMFPNLLS